MWIFEIFYNSDYGMVIRCTLDNKQLTICTVCDIVQLGLNHMNKNASTRIECKQLTMFIGVYNFVQLGPNLAPTYFSGLQECLFYPG